VSTTYAVNGRPTTVDDFQSTSVAVQNTGTVPLFIEPLGRIVDVGATVTVPGWSTRRTRVRTAGQNGTAVVTLTAGSPAAAPGPGGVTFDPGPAASMSVSISGGTWYTNEGLTTAVSFPVTVPAPVVLYPSAPASVVITATVGTTSQARGMNVTDGSAESFAWTPSTDVERAAAGVSAGSGTYARIIGPSNGTADAAVINALITAASAAGRGLVRGMPGENYALETSIVMKSGVILDLTGCTLTPTTFGIGNMLRNNSVTTARTVMDLTTTASSTAISSATAAFTASLVENVLIYGAGVQGGPLIATVTGVDATNATLSVAASTSLTNASACFGTRDTDMTVIGGKFVCAVALGSNATAHLIRIRRADNVTFRDQKFVATNGLYNLHFADCTNYTAEGIFFDLRTGASDGVHVTGPADSGVIRNIKGRSVSGLVSITPNDYAGLNDTYGPITNLDIMSIHPVGQSQGAVVAVLGGSSSPQTYAKDVHVRDVSASSNGGAVVGCGDDTVSANTTGGIIDGLVLENITGQNTGTGELISLSGAGLKAIRIRGLRADSASMTTQGLVYLPTTATCESLHVSDVRVGTLAVKPSIVRTDGYVKNLIVAGVQGDQVGHAILIHGTSGKVDRAIVRDCNAIYFQSSCYVDNSAGVLGMLEVSNIQSSTGQWGIGDFASSTEIHAVNINVNPNNGNASVNVGAAAAVITVYASHCNFQGKNITGTAGGKVRSRSTGFPVDAASTFLQNNAGDLLYNTNGASAPFVVGPAVADGTSWRALSTGAVKSGTATLVGGTVTVSDAAITAASEIRMRAATLGGTPGALYISAKVASTSFTITSTSGTDTSVVAYDVVKY
jgi:hypothetical protein